jgi:transposase InsO family protein
LRGEKLYLSPVMDLFNREIIAYQTSSSPLRLVDATLQKALRRLRRKDKPALHSDQGWQYQMRSYRETLREYGVVQSIQDVVTVSTTRRWKASLELSRQRSSIYNGLTTSTS